MIIHSFDQVPSLFLEFVAELRNVDIQQDRMRFRKNLERIGELLSYEMSKTLPYQVQRITTPLWYVLSFAQDWHCTKVY